MTPELEETIADLRRSTDFILVVLDNPPICYSNIPMSDTINTLTSLLKAIHAANAASSNTNN